jgi:KaiC/GvpD/RAD55 family RecA-like ATPase/DNA-binding response OmpR family regulator
VITTGVEALDDRLGGLRRGGLYCFFGASSAGKSVLALHFLMDGLARGESCVLVTRDEPAIIDSRALYVGYSVGRLSEHPRLRIVRMPARLPNFAVPPGEALARWLTEQLNGVRAARIVFDAMDSLRNYSDTPGALHADLAQALIATGAVSYVLARSDRDARIDMEQHHGLLERADGTFGLQVSDRGERRFVFHVVPQGTYRAEPFNYSLRIGAGFTEELTLEAPDLDPADRRRIIIVDEIGALTHDIVAGLGNLYDVELLSSAAGALGRLSAGRYGTLIIVVDPFDEARAFDLAFALRKEGNAAPIVFAAPSSGLRSTTRSRGLRVGGDDFFVTDLPAAEVIERVQMAWLRGSHRRSGLSQIGQIIQPVNGNGLTRPMTDAEFMQAMDMLLAEQPPLFFCYLEFSLGETRTDVVWPALRTSVRIGDGDIIGQLASRRVACVLDRITLDQTRRVVDRIRNAHPALQGIRDVVVIDSPVRADEIRNRLGSAIARSADEVGIAAR